MMRPMLMVSLRDLQWRRRRFAVAISATAVVFALALLMTGMSRSFGNEVSRTVASFGADAWLVPSGDASPFTAPQAFPAAEAATIARAPGVTEAAPVVIVRGTARTPAMKDVNVIGVVPGEVGSPTVTDGRAASTPGEAVVDARLGLVPGSIFTLSGHRERVSGVVHGISYFAGQSVVYVPLADAQTIGLAGRPLATAIVVHGTPTGPVPGFQVLSNGDVRADLSRPLKQATQSIALMKLLLWAVAAGIIGSIVYLSAIERLRDFAVLKASGATNRSLLGGLVLQAVIVSAAAGALSIGLAYLLKPAFAMAIEIPASAMLTLPVLAVGIGVLASLAGLRRAVRVDPALAFAGA
jgi:putative ABC transport system permease protein